jgi:hypothetical protein
MYHEFSIQIICEFLSPMELLLSRILSRFHDKIIREFIIRRYSADCNILNYVCPKCASWIDTKNPIEDYTGFKHVYRNIDVTERQRYEYIKQHLRSLPYNRCKILCDDCDAENIEICFINKMDNHIHVNSSPFFKNILKHRGDRDYIVKIQCSRFYTWGFICLKNRYNYVWNDISITNTTPLYYEISTSGLFGQ